MKHIVFYSGGIGSWVTAKRVVEKHGHEDLILLFTDTKIEDDDLYRFLIDTASDLYEITDKEDLIEKCKHIPNITKMEERKEYLQNLSVEVNERFPQFFWIADGRSVWDVFYTSKYLGNAFIAPCSHILKQKTAEKWIKANFEPGEAILYLGIDWSEDHRRHAPTKGWHPFQVEFPMCEQPYLDKKDMIDMLSENDIEIPYLYKLDFPHNNCGGFCVRAGQGKMAKFQEKLPELYDIHAQKEKDFIEFIDKDVSILRRQRKGKKVALTMEMLKEELQDAEKRKQIDMFDMGGCGCFVDDVPQH